MFNILVVCFLLCILITESFQYGNSNKHQCVNIADCPQLYNSLNDQSQWDRINQLRCGSDGFLPKVWCLKQQTCHTPDGLSGFCRPLANCAPVYQIVNNSTLVEIVTREYLQGLRCPDTAQQSSSISPERLSICCPSDENEFKNRLFPTNLLPDPDQTECGLNANNKITGGKRTELNEFPWTALLHYESSFSNNVVLCAGSLISKQYVITAAHCVEDSVVKNRGRLNRVTLGEYNVQTERDCIGNTCADPVVVANVEDVIIHPDWYTQPRQLINNDIALIRLTKPVQFSAYVTPICLPQANSNIPDQTPLEITGWGLTEDDVTSDFKRKAVVSSSNKYNCRQYYRDYKQLNIGEGVFCATGRAGADSCAGDSGGPIMLRASNVKGLQLSFLTGLVSFGSTKCGEEESPALYTQTSKYIDWIKRNMRP